MSCIQIKDDDWFYCKMCDTVAIGCDSCRMASCSGCGCDKCTEKFKLVSWLIEKGYAPSKEGLRVHDELALLDKILKRNKKDETTIES